MKDKIIEEKLDELRIQMNYICYDKEILAKFAGIWKAFYKLEEALSNCCGAEIVQQDSNGHGKCGECKENTVPDRRIELYQPLFNLMSDEHELILLQSEMDEIIDCVEQILNQ